MIIIRIIKKCQPFGKQWLVDFFGFGEILSVAGATAPANITNWRKIQ